MSFCCLKLKMLGCMQDVGLPARVHIDDQPVYIHSWSFPDKNDTKICFILYDNWPGTDFFLHVVFGSRQEQARRWRSFYQPWSTLMASPCMSSTDLLLTKETNCFILFIIFVVVSSLYVFSPPPPPPPPDMNILKHVWKFEFCQACGVCTMGNSAIENCHVSIIFLYFLMIMKMVTIKGSLLVQHYFWNVESIARELNCLEKKREKNRTIFPQKAKVYVKHLPQPSVNQVYILRYFRQQQNCL